MNPEVCSMFPIFNYGVRFDSRFPDPTPIRPVRKASHVSEYGEPVISGNALAGAFAALAATCIIVFAALRKGHVDSNMVIREARTLVKDGVDAASNKIHAAQEGLQDAAAQVGSHVAGDSAASGGGASGAVNNGITRTNRVAASTTGQNSGHAPVTSTVTEPTPPRQRVEPAPVNRATETPARAEGLAEQPNTKIDEDVIPVDGADGADPALTSQAADNVRVEPEFDDFSRPDEVPSQAPHPDERIPFTAEEVRRDDSDAIIGMKQPTAKEPKVTETTLPNGEKIRIEYFTDGKYKLNSEKHYRFNAKGQLTEEAYYLNGKLIERTAITYKYENGKEIRIEKVFNAEGKETGEGFASKPVDTPPKGSTPPSTPSGSAPPAAPGNSPPPAPPAAPPAVPPAAPPVAPPAAPSAVPVAGAKAARVNNSSLPFAPTMPIGTKVASAQPPVPPIGELPAGQKLADATPPAVRKNSSSNGLKMLQNEVSEIMLQEPFTASDGRLLSAPILDAQDQLIGCSRLEYYPNGRIARNSIYGSDAKLQEWVEIAYTPEGQIEKFVFSDGTEKNIEDFGCKIEEILGDEDKYNLLRNGLEKEVALEANQAVDKGMKAFEARDYKTAAESWRPLVKIGHTSVQDYLYEAEFQVGAAAYKEAIELTKAGSHAAPEKYLEAEQAWSALEKIENTGMCLNYKGLCHEVTGNQAKAVEAFTKAANEGDPQAMINLARHYETGEGVVGGKDFVVAKDLYEEAGATEDFERVAKVIEEAQRAEDAKTADELLARLEPLAEIKVEPQAPSPAQVLAETFGVEDVSAPIVTAKPIPPELNGAPPQALGEVLFGKPTPMPVKTSAQVAASEIDEIYSRGNSAFLNAMRFYGRKQKKAAKERFAAAERILRLLIKHDTDGTYLNLVGECLQGQGKHKEAIELFYEAAAKDNRKAMINLGAHCQAGKGLPSEAPDYALAIDFYKRATAKKNLKAMLKIDDLPKEFYQQAQAAIAELESASSEVVAATSADETAVQVAQMVN